MTDDETGDLLADVLDLTDRIVASITDADITARLLGALAAAGTLPAAAPAPLQCGNPRTAGRGWWYVLRRLNRAVAPAAARPASVRAGRERGARQNAANGAQRGRRCSPPRRPAWHDHLSMGKAAAVTDLADACVELDKRMGEAQALLHEPDSGDSTGGGYGPLHEAPGSSPPWNVAAADAYLAAYFGVRRLENQWRQARGLAPLQRGGSAGNTAACLAQLPAMEPAVPEGTVKEGLSEISGWINRIRQLRAIDETPRWVRLRAGGSGVPPACPHCQGLALRMAEGRGVVACFTPGCEDLDGRTPLGLLGVSRIDGSACLAWHDGLYTYAEN
jgi:hypothetical protein